MTKNLFFTFVSILVTSSILGQEDQPLYKSKIADLGEIQIQYMDYGGEGPTLISVQDFHNYYEGPYHNPNSPIFDFYKNLSNEFRVIEPLRRGYGKSTDTKWGYDVATQAEDLINFMDHMGIEKAVFYGRYPGNQEMTWIAEHYPERVRGLIYWNNPLVLVQCVDPDVIEFFENVSVFTPDFEKEKLARIMGSRAMWRPQFLTDSLKQINVPAIRFVDPKLERSNFTLTMMETGEMKLMSEEDWNGMDEEQQYLKELLNDSERYERLHEKLIACDMQKEIESGMKRAFGANLTTAIEEPIDFSKKGALEAYMDWQLEKILAFKKEKLK